MTIWADIQTKNGFASDEVQSSLQKYIRRAKVEEAQSHFSLNFEQGFKELDYLNLYDHLLVPVCFYVLYLSMYNHK